MARIKFLRSSTHYYKRLGRKKKQRWRKARGRDSKIREKRKNRPRKVEIGFRTSGKERGKIEGKEIKLIRNIKEAEKINKGDLIIISRVGKKKRLELEKKIKEKSGEILNQRRENPENSKENLR